MNANEIFKSGSKTFYYASKFFPKDVYDDVAKLYAFVRVPDNYVDRIPQQPAEFKSFRDTYNKALKTKTGYFVVDDFVELQKRKEMDPAWADAFLDAMESDLGESNIVSYKDMMSYIHGSAEVVGLMMLKVIDADEGLSNYAVSLGRAYQLINFIRDIDEDLVFNRTYFPHDEQKEYGIYPLSQKKISENPDGFNQFMRFQIARFRKWINDAEVGIDQLPARFRIPIRTANSQYLWTANTIQKNPTIVMRKKVKPSRARIISNGLEQTFKELILRR